MKDRDLIALMAAIILRDSKATALEDATSLLHMVDVYLERSAQSVPMSKPVEAAPAS
jgi:hypothetical protein